MYYCVHYSPRFNTMGWDMADRLDDLICTFHPGASAMETLAILLLGWIIFGAVLTLVGRFLYSKLLDVPKEALDPSATPPPLSLPATTKDAKSAISNKERFINDLKTKPPPTLPKVARSRSSSTTRSVERVSQIPEANGSPTSGFPIITGSNADCVNWVTGALSWLFKHPPVQNDLIELWKDKLNALTKISEVEVSPLVFYAILKYLDHIFAIAEWCLCWTWSDHLLWRKPPLSDKRLLWDHSF